MWFFDHPLSIILIGVVLGVFVGGAWTATGRKELLYALGAVVTLTVAWLLVERMVVTDREAVRATLAEIARDVQANNMQRVLGHIAKGNPSLVQRAQTEMPNYKFTECRVTKVHKTDIDSASEPRSALVEFNVAVTGTFSQGGFEGSGRYLRWVQLQLVREEDGKWRVQNYDHAPPQQFLFGEPLSEADN
jgi:hypothetical protein